MLNERIFLLHDREFLRCINQEVQSDGAIKKLLKVRGAVHEALLSWSNQEDIQVTSRSDISRCTGAKNNGQDHIRGGKHLHNLFQSGLKAFFSR